MTKKARRSLPPNSAAHGPLQDLATISNFAQAVLRSLGAPYDPDEEAIESVKRVADCAMGKAATPRH